MTKYKKKHKCGQIKCNNEAKFYFAISSLRSGPGVSTSGYSCIEHLEKSTLEVTEFLKKPLKLNPDLCRDGPSI